MVQFSKFGEKFNRQAGITQFMTDLSQGLRSPDTIMLGGGNPAVIPQMRDYFQQLSENMLASGALVDAISNYDGPQGKSSFIASLVELFRDAYGWDLSEKNIAITNGSQSAFFALFNLFAGRQSDGSHKKILLPLAPEYVGYSDSGVDENIFVAHQPQIELLADGQFKYHVDFEKLTLDDTIGAICVSRPSNPTGNVLTDDEIQKLDKLARSKNILLLLDNAYGTPFPNIMFEQVTPVWHDNIVLCFSLSKLGLPGVRCGIVVAHETIIQALTNACGIMSLSPGSVGAAMGHEMIVSGDLLSLSQDVIQPYYWQKSQQVIAMLQRAIKVPGFRIHKPEGAIFLWLWFENLPISSQQLYLRLKARGVLVIPGEYFFFGLDNDWQHTRECIRLNYGVELDKVQAGIEIIAEEVNRAYAES